ncbi:MAG: hypothetical protein ACI4TU_11555 [Candidatus Cryptobacteroides sp.]
MEIITLEKLFEEYIIKASKEISEKYPFQATIILCVAIEVLGNQLTDDEGSKKRFIAALEHFEALKDYRKLHYTGKRNSKCNKLYDLRCGLAHNFAPNNNNCVSISSGHNDLNNNIVGVQSLIADVKSAWETFKKGNQEKLNDIQFQITGTVTGATQTNAIQNA